ncbi:MAG: hypothetical protein E6I73_12120 [Chloroflexi bacterium]|nr:MAG: hypothetical protein E6I73_12120 [Chloroflexota bacterium]
MSLPKRVAIRFVAAMALAISLALPLTAAADPPPPGYRQAVVDTIAIVSSAQPGDIVAAEKALAVLDEGTSGSQPEIEQDLRTRPPDFADANVRLHALLDAISSPASAADPAQASQRLHQVLTMKRYDPLHQPPSLLDRLTQWIQDRINDLLRFLFGSAGRGGSQVPTVYFYIVGAAMLAAAAVIIFRSTRGHLSADAVARTPMGPRAPADFFADADRLARIGDRVGAIRALCAGVAATLAGEHSWTGSPLTVREIFQRAGDPARLRPLLLPFEAAIYGGRDVDPATYERAVVAAAPFRKPPAEAEAAA